jgi:hypothetical protein
MGTETYVQCKFVTQFDCVAQLQTARIMDKFARLATVFGAAYLCIRIGMGLFSA